MFEGLSLYSPRIVADFCSIYVIPFSLALGVWLHHTVLHTQDFYMSCNGVGYIYIYRLHCLERNMLLKGNPSGRKRPRAARVAIRGLVQHYGEEKRASHQRGGAWASFYPLHLMRSTYHPPPRYIILSPISHSCPLFQRLALAALG